MSGAVIMKRISDQFVFILVTKDDLCDANNRHLSRTVGICILDYSGVNKLVSTK